jgi:ribosomal protein L37AE/L43A
MKSDPPIHGVPVKRERIDSRPCHTCDGVAFRRPCGFGFVCRRCHRANDNARYAATRKRECPRCGALREQRTRKGIPYWYCAPCRINQRPHQTDAAKAKLVQQQRLRDSNEKSQAELEAIELEKIATRIAWTGVRNYYDPREAQRREWEARARQARAAAAGG